jgi:ABC-type dipeptide/oligopeptide/nickel transport system permease component
VSDHSRARQVGRAGRPLNLELIVSRWGFAARRLAILPVQVFVMVTLIFFVIHVLPGSPIFKQLGIFHTQAQAQQLTQQLGLNRSLPHQYASFLSGLIKGDLGTSFTTSNAVTQDLRDVFPATLELAIAALSIGLLLGGTFGIISGLKARGPLGQASSAYRLVAGAIPEFWLGLILVYLFVTILGVLPGPTGQLPADAQPPSRVTGMTVIDSLIAGNWSEFRSALELLLLPALVLGFSIGGPIARQLRILIADSRQSDYVQYAQMAGLRRRTIIGYVVHSALVPLTTLIAVLTVIVMSQSVAVEVVFSWGGLGQYTVQAVANSDYVAVQGVVLVTCTFVLLVYLVTDVVQAALDPRVALAHGTTPNDKAPPGWMKRRWVPRSRSAPYGLGSGSG